MFLNQDKNNLGYWSPVTSSVDWCEPNFEHFDTVAETYNTFSSVAYLILELWFIYVAERLYRTNAITKNLRLTRTYLEIFGGLVVGIGTYLFHMTLLREHQMLDELSMNATILVHLYCMINMDDEENGKFEHGWRKVLQCFGLFNTSKAAITAVVCCTLFSISFAVYDTMIPIVFQTLFGLSILSGVTLSVMQALKKYQVSAEHSKHFQKARRDKMILISMVVGVSCVGFGVWLIDNNMCPRFEHLKLHAWWHICTALAAYIWGIFAVHCHCTDKLARQIASGETAAMTEVNYLPLPSVVFVKLVEKKKVQ
jgi:dihydroceramidase